MRLIVCIENEDLEVFVIRNLNQSNDEDVLGGKEFVTAFAAARNFIKDPMRNEPVQDLAQGRQRSERLSTVASRVDNLHGDDGACTR